MRAVLLILSFLLVAPTVLAQSGTSVDQPVPRGTEAQVGDYLVQVVEVEADATTEVMELVGSGARKPSFGHVFAVVWIQATYVGEDPGNGAELAGASFVGAKHGNPLSATCPELSFEQLNAERAGADILPEETVELGYCLEVRPGEIHQALLQLESSGASLFFSLDRASGTSSDGTPVASPVP